MVSLIEVATDSIYQISTITILG